MRCCKRSAHLTIIRRLKKTVAESCLLSGFCSSLQQALSFSFLRCLIVRSLSRISAIEQLNVFKILLTAQHPKTGVDVALENALQQISKLLFGHVVVDHQNRVQEHVPETYKLCSIMEQAHVIINRVTRLVLINEVSVTLLIKRGQGDVCALKMHVAEPTKIHVRIRRAAIGIPARATLLPLLHPNPRQPQPLLLSASGSKYIKATLSSWISRRFVPETRSP